ncbi:hypothetical protein KBK24_0137295 [Burkholderia sp. K24]|nr:hypothetical protein KBK24_0137295 [Burkholderia sp. K24]
MRWRLTTSTGKNYGLFNTHERAERFATGVLMGLDEPDYVSITREPDSSFYTWLGDSIGRSDLPACVSILDQFGQHREYSVFEVLSRAHEINARGLNRIVSALRLFASTGQLHPDDLAAWREVEDEFPICYRTGEVL